MRDGGNLRSLFFPDLEDLHHERDGVVLFEPLCYGFGEHRGGEWAERFPPFDLGVENGLHIRAPWITQDRAIAEGARTPLHTPLEPAENGAFGDRRRRAPAELLFIPDF